MSRITKLPLQRQITVREARDTVLLHIRSKAIATGAVNNLSGYTFRGDVKAKKGATGAAICAVRFDNDLANGVVKAYLNNTDAAALVAAVGANGTAYADIVRTDGTGWDDPFAEITITSSLVVTGEAAP